MRWKMSDFGKMVNEVASGTIGAYRAAMAEGYRRGQEEMRERAAKVASVSCNRSPEKGEWPCEEHQHLGNRIRALPLTDPEDK